MSLLSPQARRALSKVVKTLSLLDPRLRYGAIYVIPVLDPHTLAGEVTGWVGQSRYPRLRWVYHRRQQPWADTMGEPFIAWESPRVSNLGLWWREIWRIIAYRPLYNFEWNRTNPRRIPIWEQRCQRGARSATFFRDSQRSMPDSRYRPGRRGGPRTPLRPPAPR